MAPLFFVVFFVISHLSFVSIADAEKISNPKCPSFRCGKLGYIGFPFSNRSHPECGLLMVDYCNDTFQKIQLGKDGLSFYISHISQDNAMILHKQVPLVDDQVRQDEHSCEYFKNLTIHSYPFLSFEMPRNQINFRCPANQSIPTNLNLSCNDSKLSILYYNGSQNHFTSSPPQCSHVSFLQEKTEKRVRFLNLYTGWFMLKVHVTEECVECHLVSGGQCQSNSKGKFHCSNAKTGNGKLRLKLGLGLGLGGLAVLLVVLSLYITGYGKKRNYSFPIFNSRCTSSDPSSKSEQEVGNVYFAVPIFSYSELAKATKSFSHEKKLGDGGFGTVYYAKLRDGREVAVKRLYEHNYRRVQQFINEVEILTRLRHRNLVSLYGCTSRHCQQGLLLVYEYVPNGTVADHLRGDRVKPGSLTWPIRLNIAIETATALAYLHASDIIHRDVKTNNILLDDNFSVKVADFGLSRLFPTDVTHVSTAPQGSPGYVDPEYHQCYQLTDKSDVYSFGVILIELLSSMPAVDISRQKNEVNLANLAINRIQKCVIEELVDPSLGYQSDEEVKRMTTSIAELAFLCLQQMKEMRPSMDAVLEELKRIESGESKLENLKEEKDNNNDVLQSMQPPPDCDHLALLKHMRMPSSPISVTAKWVSSNTAPNVSI